MPAGTFLPPGLTTSDVKISTGGTNNQVLTAVDSETIQGEANLTFDGSTLTVTGDAVVTGNLDIDGTIEVGATTDGYDVKFWGNTSNTYMLWDENTDDLVLTLGAELYFYDAAGGEHIKSDGTDMTIYAGTDLVLSVGADVNIPTDKGLTFGDDGQKIESDGTDFTIASGAKLNLTPTSDVHVANGTGVVIGHTAQVSTNVVPEFQILGAGQEDSYMLIGRWQNNAYGPSIQIVKSRDPAISDGSFAIVQDDDQIGEIQFRVDDGTDYQTISAQWYAEVDDGSPAANDVGAAFVWKQLPGGGGSLQETMRIGANGIMTLGGGATRDSGILFNGDGTDTYIGFDGGTNDLMIGSGTTIGSNSFMTFSDTFKNIGIGHTPTSGNLGIQYEDDITGSNDQTTMAHFGIGIGGQHSMNTQNDSISYSRAGTLDVNRPVLTINGSDSVADAFTLRVANEPQAGTRAYALWVDAGKSRFDGVVGIGTDTPLSMLHVVDDGNAMRFHEHGSSDVAEFKLVGAADHDVALYFGDANDEVEAGFYWDTSAAMLKFNGHNNSTRMVIDPNGNLLINSTTVPTETGSTLSHGILIDQGADDGDAFQIRNSDVGHDVTDVKATDVFFAIRKAGGTSGGAMLEGFRDADQDAGFAFLVRGTLAEAADTTEASDSIGIVQMDAAVKSTNARGAVAADGNAFVVSNNLIPEFIVKGDGELYSNQSATVATFDSYDDAQLIRTLDHARKPSTMINDKWDEFIKYNEQDLIDARILGDTMENGGMINVTGLQRLHNGAIWQGYTRQMELQEEVNELKTRLLALEGGK